jgi:hypothetical protein
MESADISAGDAIVTLKAFGDFVIACHAIRNVLDSPVGIIAGYHVRELASALGVQSQVTFIGGPNNQDVPSLFDVRKRGVAAAVRNGLQLREDLLQVGKGRRLLSVSNGFRERFLLANHKHIACAEPGRNVYYDYDALLLRAQLNRQQPLRRIRNVSGMAVIFPDAREEYRRIPSNLIAQMVKQIEKLGYSVRVARFTPQEARHLQEDDCKSEYSSFDELVSFYRDADFIVSADTLTGHLAEYLQIPVFISTPAAKPYWLPRSAFDKNAWAVFFDNDPLAAWLSLHTDN